MKHFKIYKRLTEDLIDDLSSGADSIDHPPLNTTQGDDYIIETVEDGYKRFQVKDENLFTIDKVAGYDTDPFFKTQIKTQNDNIGGKNFFFTAYWGGEYPYYNYGAIASGEGELYTLLRELGIEQALQGRYTIVIGNVRYRYRYQDIWPFEDGK